MQGGRTCIGGSLNQAGLAVLPVVLALGLVLVIVQAYTWNQSKSGAAFLSSERKKVLAMQLAEAGVEENIADLGNGTLVASPSLANATTYDHKTLEYGSYSSVFTTVAMGAGPAADTVDLISTGVVGSVLQTINARLRLNKHITTTVTAPADPGTMPSVTSTAAYAACLADALPTCQVCHLPAHPSIIGRMVLTQADGWMVAHNSHTGDYITTDGTCNLYTGSTFTSTGIKVQILAWK